MTKLRKHYSRFIRKGPMVSLFARSLLFLCMCDQVYFRSYLLPLPAGVDEKEQEKFVLWGECVAPLRAWLDARSGRCALSGALTF